MAGKVAGKEVKPVVPRVRLASDTACVVCCHVTEVWAVGECNHPTCLLCCARMRVLCDQKDCPVCRMSLKQIAVVSKVSPYQKLSLRDWRFLDRQYEMHFRTRELYNDFRKIIENRCKLCAHLPPFKSFARLREHINRTHNLHFCDICVDNLKLFPAEFKLYTRQKLTAHRRDGDVDDSSYKGHPYCQFCDERYLDNDALHMHLRKQHFWCHFCESDGKQDFYPDLHYLQLHFKKEHYLCEEGHCQREVLTSAFRNEIDYKAHLASSHSKGLSKAEMKKMRHLPVEFTVHSTAEDDAVAGNRRRALPVRGGNGGGHTRETHIREREERELAVAMSASLHEPKAKEKEKERKPIKKQPPGRRKVVCTQKDPEPPPGFEVLRKKPDNVKLKKEVLEKPLLVIDQSDTVERDGVSGSGLPKSENWPSLTGGPGTSNSPDFVAVAEVAPPPGFHKHLHNDSPAHPPVLEEPCPSNSVTPPPGYARVSQPPRKSKPKPSSTPSKVALSSHAFPPLPSETAAAPVVVAESSGGSKVFEDIRRALNYDTAKFKEFQTFSGWFRCGDMSIRDYNTQCLALFGTRWSSEIGPLVAKVMPQGEKREELRLMCSGNGTQQQKGKKRNKAKKPSNAWVRGREEERTQGEAAIGNQGVMSNGLVSEEDYPSLSVASKLPQAKNPTYGNTVWNVPVHS